MKSVGTKIREARERKSLVQREISELTGITVRAISNYETDTTRPRGKNLRKMCEVLNITPAYLLDPEIEDPEYGKETNDYVETVRSQYGNQGAADVQDLLDGTLAMMAGGDVPQTDKDLFFQAVMEAYVQTRKDASERFTPKKFRHD